MAFRDVARVVERAVNVGAAVVERGEQEPELGRADDPVGPAAAEGVLVDVITQRGLCLLDRADGAQDVGVHLRGGVVLPFPVLRAAGHVVFVRRQQDQVAALLQNAESCLHFSVL